MTQPHRKRKVTYNVPGHAHFVTYSCHQRLPLLSKDRSCQWVVDAIDKARVKLDFDLWAYVIMPEHVHLLIHPRRETYSMRGILAALKRPVSGQGKRSLLATNNAVWLARLTVTKGRKKVFRFWLPGGGYDENLCSDRPIHEVIDYIHANPVRHGLADNPLDWRWSSARFWEGDRSGPLTMDMVVL
jgi:putative transposase